MGKDERSASIVGNHRRIFLAIGFALVVGYGIGHTVGVLVPRADKYDSLSLAPEAHPPANMQAENERLGDHRAPDLDDPDKNEQLKVLAKYFEDSRDEGVAWLLSSGINPFDLMEWSSSRLDVASVMDALIAADVAAAVELASATKEDTRAPWMALFVSRLSATGHSDTAMAWLREMPPGWTTARSACELAGRLLPRNAEALAQLVRDLTPDQNIGENRPLRDALTRWAADDPEASLAWVEKIGPALAGWAMIPALEQIMAVDPDRALSLAPKLADDSANFFAEIYQTSKVLISDPERVLEAASIAPESHFKRGVVGRVLASWLESDPDAAIAWLQDHKDEKGLAAVIGQASDPMVRGKHWTELLGSPLGEALGIDPMQTILLQERDERIEAFESLPEQQQHDLTADMAGLLARNDVVEAAAWIQSLDGSLAVEATERVAEEWTKYDSYTASQWISDLPGGAPKDVAVRAMVESIAKDNPDAAGVWLGQIGDDSVRRQAVDELLKAWVDLPESSRVTLAKSEYLTDGDRAILLEGKL